MSGWKLIPPSWTSGATATATSEATSDVGASNLLAVQRSRLYRSSGLSGIQITLDAGEAKDFDTVVLLGTNGFDGTARVTANASTGSLFSAPSVDSGSQNIRLPGDLSAFTEVDFVHQFSSVHTYRYIGIEIVDASNPDGYFQAGVAMAGVRFEPPLGPEIGFRFGLDDDSNGIRLLGGELIVRPKRPNMTASWTFTFQSHTIMYQFLGINRVYGSQVPVVVLHEPFQGDYQQHNLYYGYLQWRAGGAISYINATGGGYYDVDIGILEL